MSANVHPIWEPRDAVDTAEQFALELANAERGVAVEHHESPWWITASRERKARLYDAAAVALLLVVSAGLGVVLVLACVPR